jgi:hypothetical protein
VVDHSPLSFQFSGYRQHCAVLDLSLLAILFHPFPLGSIARLDYFVFFLPPQLLGSPLDLFFIKLPAISPAVPLVDQDLQFYSFTLTCFVGKLWWIGSPSHFTSLGTVSIVRCLTCLYWAFCFTHFLSALLRILITLFFLIFNFCCSTKILSTNLPPLSYHSCWCCHHET